VFRAFESPSLRQFEISDFSPQAVKILSEDYLDIKEAAITLFNFS
jgi:hypothetical protein